jgi:hypothetical protein
VVLLQNKVTPAEKENPYHSGKRCVCGDVDTAKAGDRAVKVNMSGSAIRTETTF